MLKLYINSITFDSYTVDFYLIPKYMRLVYIDIVSHCHWSRVIVQKPRKSKKKKIKTESCRKRAYKNKTWKNVLLYARMLLSFYSRIGHSALVLPSFTMLDGLCTAHKHTQAQRAYIHDAVCQISRKRKSYVRTKQWVPSQYSSNVPINTSF